MTGFLRRLLGGRDEQPDDHSAPEGAPPVPAADLEAEERAYERELLRQEAARLDELRQRQLRYAEHAWTPPPQGGERRADDEDATGGRGGD